MQPGSRAAPGPEPHGAGAMRAPASRREEAPMIMAARQRAPRSHTQPPDRPT